VPEKGVKIVPRKAAKTKGSERASRVPTKKSFGQPYGFRLEPEPRELEIVRSIYAWHREGLSLREIAARLNDKHVPTKTQAASGWQAETIRLILNNRALYGAHLGG
jgi:hypothetical protein